MDYTDGQSMGSPFSFVRRLVARGARWLLTDGAGVPRDPWEANAHLVDVHPSAMIDPLSRVKFFNPPSSARTCVSVGAESHVFASFSLLRPDASIRVGRRTQLGASQIIATQSVDIGDDVLMAWGCTLVDSDMHSLYWDERKDDVMRSRQAYQETDGEDIARRHAWEVIQSAPVRIGDKVWMGFNVTVLKGVTIGEGAVIAAASVVTRDVEPWTLVGGNPCRPIRKIPRARAH